MLLALSPVPIVYEGSEERIEPLLDDIQALFPEYPTYVGLYLS